MRHTRIVATVGPATNTQDSLRDMCMAGASVFRLNFSHCSHDQALETITQARSISKELGVPVAVLQDLCGPKIRTGKLDGGAMELVPGHNITITTKPILGGANRISTTYEHFAKDVRPGDRILLADGEMELRAISTADDEVNAEVVFGGTLGDSKGINLPGVALSCPALTEKDLDDLKFGLEQGVDYVALSFVRRGEEMQQLRQIIDAAGSDARTIAKIEKPEALDDLDAIFTHSDAIMVARGDLGVELSPEQVPTVQKDIIRRANRMGVPVITATQMLESMTHSPRPTRAEASDVANAILDGTDAVMLSAETSIGQYPVRAVRTMANIAEQVEASEPFARLLEETRLLRHVTFEDAAADAACHAAHTINAKAIVAFTMSGATAGELSQRRPGKPIYALTPRQSTYQCMALEWGVQPIVIPQGRQMDEQLQMGERALLDAKLVSPGDIVVIVVGTSPVKGATDTIKIHRIAGNG